MSDERLVARGVTRAQVIADLEKVIRHCGGVPGAADALELGKSTVYATRSNNPLTRIGDAVLVALYGPEGCELPEAWQAEPEEEEEVAADGRTMLAAAPIEAARVEVEPAGHVIGTDGPETFVPPAEAQPPPQRPPVEVTVVHDPRPPRDLPPQLIPTNIEATGVAIVDAAAGLDRGKPCSCSAPSSPLIAAIDADIEAATARLDKLRTARTLIEELQL